MVELVVGTVGAVGTAVVVALAVAHTAEAAVDAAAAAGVGVVHTAEAIAAVAHRSLAAAARAIAVQRQALGADSEV